jgi:uncharacterized lipoprotein YbaY
MRIVRGTVVLPMDARAGTASVLLVEARDVSLMDVPSVVVAEERLPDVTVEPGGRLPFELSVPDAEAGHTLAARAHLSYDGTAAITPGDAISVTHLAIPPDGDVDGLEVPLRVI